MAIYQNIHTLYISDLDGTLLNCNAELSEYTVSTLNRLIADGINFSVATARTAATAVPILAQVAINIPIILMNGVLIYDIQTRQYIKKEVLALNMVERILSALHKTGQTGLMYTLTDNELLTYYESLGSEAQNSFIKERETKYHKKFTCVEHLADVRDRNVIYFCIINLKENILKIYDELENTAGLRLEMYQNIYSEAEWYLEVFSDAASKHNAVQYLRQQYNFKKIIGFGDNLNDIPLLAACDESYAVANAKPELMVKATGIIDTNQNDGVIKKIESLINCYDSPVPRRSQ